MGKLNEGQVLSYLSKSQECRIIQRIPNEIQRHEEIGKYYSSVEGLHQSKISFHCNSTSANCYGTNVYQDECIPHKEFAKKISHCFIKAHFIQAEVIHFRAKQQSR